MHISNTYPSTHFQHVAQIQIVQLRPNKLLLLLRIRRINSRCNVRQNAALVRHLYLNVRSHRDHQQFYALLDPIVRTDGLPILRANNIEESLVQSPLHRFVKNAEELRPNMRLSTPERVMNKCIKIDSILMTDLYGF